MTSELRDESFWDNDAQEPVAPRRGRRQRGADVVAKVERVETRGRARALQALYAADLRDLTKRARLEGKTPVMQIDLGGHNYVVLREDDFLDTIGVKQ